MLSKSSIPFIRKGREKALIAKMAAKAITALFLKIRIPNQPTNPINIATIPVI